MEENKKNNTSAERGGEGNGRQGRPSRRLYGKNHHRPRSLRKEQGEQEQKKAQKPETPKAAEKRQPKAPHKGDNRPKH